MRGKLIVVEGTDCSGKATQVELLMKNLIEYGFLVDRYAFPSYDTPTGKIIGGPYLGKESICEGWFPEGAPHVDSKISALFYAADRKYNISLIECKLNQGITIILDRYTYSNMAHQGGKEKDSVIREQFYNWISELEFGFLALPVPDIRIFLHMPFEAGKILKNSRQIVESLDQNERDDEHLKQAEAAYLEIAQKFDFYTIECVSEKGIRSVLDTQDELLSYVVSNL